jgi:hypothetical protein
MDQPKSVSRKLFEDAVEDAQFLVAHAASKCKKSIDGKTIRTLINARQFVEQQQAPDPKAEAEFWLAYQHVWELVSPVTAESIKANLPVEVPLIARFFKNIPLLSTWLGRLATSKARRTVNRYIAFTISVLLLLLILQIYWVIGNQLTIQLAALLQRETELSLETSQNRADYNTIEIRFKQNEIDSESYQTNGVFTFYSSPEWERETLENLTAKSRLETELESLKAQLERSSAILLVWSNPWNWLISESVTDTNAEELDQYSDELARITRQMDEIEAQLKADPDGTKKIQQAQTQIADLQAQLVELELTPETNAESILNLRAQLESLTAWVNQPDQAAQIISQLNQDLDRLKAQETSLERQKEGDLRREVSHQAQLAAQFVLVVLQSYLLPLLYGLLGASTSVLRSLSRQIEHVIFSEEAGIQHLLRISLGALAGIMVGWFSFLLPNDSLGIVGSISPLAIAFLVGYNIELFFSLMDIAIQWANDRRPKTSQTDVPPIAQKVEPPAETKHEPSAPPIPPAPEVPAPA